MIEKLFPLARMKDSFKNAISLDRKDASIRFSIWKKGRKRFPLAEIRYFFKYWHPSNCNNDIQKMKEWKSMVSIKQKSPLPLAVIKDVFKIYSQEI